jgi:hypothetical protein
MSTIVSVRDVARAAGVDKSTVSRVLSGKADQNRIRQTTRDHILAVSRQLGYTRRPMAPYAAAAAPSPQVTSPKTQIQEPRIGLVLSAASPSSSLALIPALDPILSAAGYELVVMTLPADPASARARFAGFLNTSSGILCCPTIYPIVSAIIAEAARTCPTATWPGKVVSLWQGAAKAIIAKPATEAPAPTYAPASLSMEGAALSAPVNQVVLTEQNPPLSETPASTPQPAVEVPPLASTVDADVTSASLSVEGAALSAPVDEVVLTEQNPPLRETPASTPQPAVEVPPLASTVDADVPAASLQMEGAALSAPADEVVLTEQNPPLSETPAPTPQPAVEVPPAASTLLEPEIQRPLPSASTTEQPNNLTTVSATGTL